MLNVRNFLGTILLVVFLSSIFYVFAPAGQVWAAEPEQTTFEQYKQMAEKGNADAQKKLGELYEQGKGVGADIKESAKWYAKAAEQGVAEAQHKLGEFYEQGKGVAQNTQESLKWFGKAAEQNFKAAQDKLKELGKSAQDSMKDLNKDKK
jgi:uncharacterized protein